MSHVTIEARIFFVGF
jgi:hypothetical protein